MKITNATVADVHEIHALMIRAYEEYKVIPASSTALDETPESIEHALETNEMALLLHIEGRLVGTVRYGLNEEALFFSRLAVDPAARGRGVAGALLKELEKRTIEAEKERIRCKVRMSIVRNMRLYEFFGYTQYSQITEEVKGFLIDVAKMEKVLV